MKENLFVYVILYCYIYIAKYIINDIYICIYNRSSKICNGVGS